MKKNVVRAALGMLALSVTAGVQAQVSAEDMVKFRQSGFTFMSWNMGKIKANLEGNYDAAQVSAAANAIASIAGSGMGALYGAGTDKSIGDQKTRVKPELFQNMPEVGKLAGDFNTATANLAKVAATGDAAAVKVAFGDVGKSCKACHDKFRED